MKHIIRTGAGVLVAGILAAGCKTAPPASEVAAADTAIGNASQTIDRAAADPHVAKYASSELERANESLGQARRAWNDKHDLKTTEHQAYLAQQRAAIAEQLANERAAEAAVLVAANNRDTALRVAAAERSRQPEPKPGGQQMEEGLAGFAFGSAKLPAQAKPAIDDMANALKDKPNAVVVVEGHTDNVGGADYNKALARKRAEAVRAELVRRGVESSRVTVRSQGEANPVASNGTSAGRRENRRAEVFIADSSTGNMGAVGSSQGSTASTGSGSGESGQSGQSGQNTQHGQQGQQEPQEPPEQHERK